MFGDPGTEYFLMAIKRQIVAFGGGGFSMESGNPLLDDFVTGLTGLKKPRVCFLPTASGDADHYVVRYYNAFRNRSEASHISLFRREKGVEDIRDHLLSQDLIYVGGGSVISMLGVWRAHGIDEILREAWERGIVLCGLSAGSLCWFDEGLTGYQDAEQEGSRPRVPAVLEHGPFRSRFETASGLRNRAQGWPAAGLCGRRRCRTPFRGHASWPRSIASRPEARAYRLELRGDRPKTTQIATRFLGSRDHIPLVADSSLPWSSSPLAA